MKRAIPGLSLCLLLCITAVHWTVISTSMVSLGLFFILALRDGLLWMVPWSRDVLEYWIAAATWLTATALCASVLLRSPRRQHGSFLCRLTRRQRRSISFLGLMLCAALTAPFLAPIGPNVQGTLSTTRLLPPLSRGTMVVSPEEHTARSGDLLQQTFLEANARLLRRSSVLTGNDVARPATGTGLVFWFGTDDTGRDVLSRVLFGTRVSLALGLLGTLGALLIGTGIGLVSGLRGDIINTLLMRFADLILAVPSLVLIAAAVAFIGHSMTALVVIFTFTGWVSIARVVRSEVLTLRDREFVLAARLLRLPARRIVIRHILPHLAPLLFTAAVLQFGSLVLAEAALGFLGLGIQPPTPSWGNMMHEATGYLSSAWWLGVFPGAVLASVLVASQVAGEGGDREE